MCTVKIVSLRCFPIQEGESKAVAVKGFLSPESSANTQDCTVEELLDMAKEQANLYYAYK